MSLEDAIALQPAWLGYWLNWLMFGAFILPIALLFWRQSRLAGIVTVGVGILAALGVFWLFDRFGYVRLLGLPHVLLWTPLLVFLLAQYRRIDMPEWPRRILVVVMLTILASLAFDYADLLRYILGERADLTRQ